MKELRFYTIREILNIRCNQRMSMLQACVNRYDDIVISTDNMLEALGAPRRYTESRKQPE